MVAEAAAVARGVVGQAAVALVAAARACRVVAAVLAAPDPAEQAPAAAELAAALGQAVACPMAADLVVDFRQAVDRALDRAVLPAPVLMAVAARLHVEASWQMERALVLASIILVASVIVRAPAHQVQVDQAAESACGPELVQGAWEGRPVASAFDRVQARVAPAQQVQVSEARADRRVGSECGPAWEQARRDCRARIR